jgi:hypothetical protein
MISVFASKVKTGKMTVKDYIAYIEGLDKASLLRKEADTPPRPDDMI